MRLAFSGIYPVIKDRHIIPKEILRKFTATKKGMFSLFISSFLLLFRFE